MYYDVNVGGTETLLKVSRECGVKQFIHTSSSSVVFAGRDLKGIHLFLFLFHLSFIVTFILLFVHQFFIGVNETQPFAAKHIDPYSYHLFLSYDFCIYCYYFF